MVNMFDNYLKNIDQMTPNLALQESSFSSATDAMNRARELMLEASNGSMNAGDRKKIAAEMAQIRDQMIAIGNTRNADGTYLFAGSRIDQPPFVKNAGNNSFSYQGNSFIRALDVNPNRRVETNTPGNMAFGTADDPARAINALVAAVDNLENPVDDKKAMLDAIGMMDTALDSISVATTRIGALLNTLEAEKSVQTQFVTDIKAERSALADLDYPTAISELNLRQTVLQAAMQSAVKTQGLSLFNYL
jgi:flagellar hook-associated protein 3 FlgL